MREFGKNVATWLFGIERSRKRSILVTFDGLVASISLLLAFFMRLENTYFLYQIDTYFGVLIAVTVALFVFAARGQYNNFTRHISFDAAYSIAIGSLISCVVLLSAILLLELSIPRSVPFIYATFLCLIAAAARFFIRAISQKTTKEEPESVAIYGTGADSIQLMDALQKNVNYRVRIFIDDSPELNGKNISGVDIVNITEFLKKIKQLEIKILLLTSPGYVDDLSSRIFNELSDYPLKIKTVPSVTSLISGLFEIAELRDLKIEDLLGREPAQQNPELMAKTIAGKTILVTGAGGSIGSELCRQIILRKPRKLILLDVSEFAIYNLLEELKRHQFSSAIDLVEIIGSVQDRPFLEKIFECFSVDTIYHAAAYKHVPLMEQNVMQCIANNVVGTINVAELALVAEVKDFILISTDKAVNPTNFMGASKRLAEIFCQNLSTQNHKTCFSIVRFGNVLGSSGSVVPLFKKQIQKGGPITLTHLEVTRYFMTIPEAAELVIQSGAIAKGGEVFVLDMGKPIKIIDLAKKMATLSGLQPIISQSAHLQDGEILITVTGLRAGEKLFEELTYGTNLMSTIHPRINVAVEKPMKQEELESMFSRIRDAIRDGDYGRLYQVIALVIAEFPDVKGTSDVFMRGLEAQPDKISKNL